jgi:hypothetical protein
MRRFKKLMKDTDNSRVYKMAKREGDVGCPLCAPHKGCNKYKFGFNNNWKEHRKTQWK